MRRVALFALASVCTLTAPLSAQQSRPLSPPAVATTMVAGEWGKNAQGNPVYQGGKWIEIEYSRPMLRQRDNIFGSGTDYGKTVNAGAPVWRVGANHTTVFRTEVPLVFGGKTLPAGEYSMFVELKGPEAWTLIFSSWPRQAQFNPDDKTALYGSAGYTPDKDVLRMPMHVTQADDRIDQLTIVFVDVAKDKGSLAIAWDKTIAAASFTVASVAGTQPPSARQRPLSPPQLATAMLGGEWSKNADGNMIYEGGKWIEVLYSAPMLRQRANVFGAGADYGKAVLATAPVWRVGANQTTRFKTEVPLVFGGKTLPAGEYSMFVDLTEKAWTLIFSSWPAQQKYNPDDKTALWGAYNYTPDKDVLRVQMDTEVGDDHPSIDQLTILFCDVTKDSGKLMILWEKTIAASAFKVAK